MEDRKHVPTIDELIELPEPGDARMSPDGTHVAYVVKTPDWERNEYLSQIWLVDVAKAKPRQLTFAKRSSTSPRWSPDGQWLAFLSKREEDDHVQIYRMSPFGGEAERLTELETDGRALAWSPDGKSIAYIAPDLESEAQKERQEKHGEYHVEDEDYTRAHLWLLRLPDSKCCKLTSGDAFHVTGLDWHPEGDRIAFEARLTPDAKDWDRGRVYVVDLATLEVQPLSDKGCDSPRWSPDGGQIAFTRNGEPSYYANNELYVMAADGGALRVLSRAFDENIWLVDWGLDGLYYLAVQRTAIHLFRIDPQSGEFTRLTPKEPEGWVSLGCTFSRDFAHAAMVGGDMVHYAEVTVLHTGERTVRRLTDFNARVEDWKLGQNEVFEWTSSDGTPIEGVLTVPADFHAEAKRPLLVVIHGGPTWVSLPALLLGYDRRTYPIQQWVAKGALILQPNYRGSAGYGEAFRALNVRNLGLGDYEDVVSGVDALIARGWVDGERVGAMGWSQGGYISAFLTTYSDRFKAVSVGAGISNWVTYYVNTDIHPFTRQYLGATPWEDAEVYRQTSPMTYIRQAKTPTLIQHGELDRRVPIPNAYELYQGLQDMGVETRLVVYKDMPHGITKPRLNRQGMQENLAWFDRWIWGEEAQAEAALLCYVALSSVEMLPDERDLPAIDRYTAPRIHEVYHWARRDGADFRIFSGRFGLLRACDPIPWYDHELRADEVSELAARVAGQLKEQELRRLVLYTGETAEQPWALIHLGCLQVAAGTVGDVTVEHRQVSEEGW